MNSVFLQRIKGISEYLWTVNQLISTYVNFFPFPISLSLSLSLSLFFYESGDDPGVMPSSPAEYQLKKYEESDTRPGQGAKKLKEDNKWRHNVVETPQTTQVT